MAVPRSRMHSRQQSARTIDELTGSSPNLHDLILAYASSSLIPCSIHSYSPLMASASNATDLELTHTVDNMIAVVQLRGHLDGNSQVAAETYFKMVVTSGSARVVLDLSQVDFISSAGLRAVLTLLKLVKGSHGALAVCASQPPVKQLFEFSGLKTLFLILPTVDEGRAALVARFG